jgi:hypothetical protein
MPSPLLIFVKRCHKYSPQSELFNGDAKMGELAVPELHAYFKNCPIVGEERTKHANGWRLDTIRLTYGGFQFRIVQRSNHLGHQATYDNTNVHTTDVYVTDVTARTLRRVHAMLRDLAWLLSLATYSDVSYFGYEFKQGTTLRSHWGTAGSLRYFRPPFQTADGAAIRQFLEQSWPKFTKLKNVRKLGIVIHYILLADRHEQPVEVQLLLAFVALESLKTTYARSKRIPFIAGRFRRVSSPPRRNPRSERPYTFEELLKMMLCEVKMRKTGLKEPIKLRNAIIHSGIASARPRTLHRMHDSVQDILREYLLRLLNYKGHFWRYTPSSKLKKIR